MSRDHDYLGFDGADQRGQLIWCDVKRDREPVQWYDGAEPNRLGGQRRQSHRADVTARHSRHLQSSL